MAGDQLPLFQKKTYKGIITPIPYEIKTPSLDQTVLQILPAYYEYLKNGGFSDYTVSDFAGDIKKFGTYYRGIPIKDINPVEIQEWLTFLKTSVPKGEGLSEKTISRKLTAVGNYFTWLTTLEVFTSEENPMRSIQNHKVVSPLPEVLFEEEAKRLFATASSDPRTYLLFILFLETGLKLEEVCILKTLSFDFSDKYNPEVFIRHTGKKEKKSRKLKLPENITEVFTDYISTYNVNGLLFPYTQRFIRYLITDTAQKAGVKKKVSAQILRDTCAVRQLKRGEEIERVLKRLGLSETTWEDAKEKYLKLAERGI